MVATFASARCRPGLVAVTAAELLIPPMPFTIP
jgi:hypothetical protein